MLWKWMDVKLTFSSHCYWALFWLLDPAQCGHWKKTTFTERNIVEELGLQMLHQILHNCRINTLTNFSIVEASGVVLHRIKIQFLFNNHYIIVTLWKKTRPRLIHIVLILLVLNNIIYYYYYLKILIWRQVAKALLRRLNMRPVQYLKYTCFRCCWNFQNCRQLPPTS